MITLLPALLVIFGRWMFWPKRPTFGSAEPTIDRLLGQGRRLHRPAAAHGLDRHRARARRLRPRGADPEHQRPLDRGLLHQGVRLGRRVRRCSTEHGLADNSTPLMVVANADQADEVAAAMTGIDNLEDAEPADRQGRRRVHHRQPDRRLDHARRPSTPSTRCARRCTPWRAPTPWWAAQSAIFDDMLKANTRDSKVIIPVTLVVVLLILMLLLRALAVAADPDRARWCCPSARPWDSSAWRSSTSSTTRAPTRASRCSCSCSWSRSASTTTSS